VAAVDHRKRIRILTIDGTRLTQTAYIEIARKNGKTALAAGMGLDGLINDGEDGAEIYFAANSRDQVKISAWPLCSNFATGLDPKGKLLTVYRDTVKFDATKSFLNVLASDSTKLDGPDPHMFILDEYHAAKTNSVKAVLESGQGNRENPLAIIITTAGFDKLGPCYELRDTAVDILHNLKEDDSFFCAVFTLDKDDDWKDPAVWIKSNPNLNVTVRPQYLQERDPQGNQHSLRRGEREDEEPEHLVRFIRGMDPGQLHHRGVEGYQARGLQGCGDLRRYRPLLHLRPYLRELHDPAG